MVLKEIELNGYQTFTGLVGQKLTYTVNKPFSSRSKRRSFYSGTIEEVNGNNVRISDERDLILDKYTKTEIRSIMEFEEVFQIVEE